MIDILNQIKRFEGQQLNIGETFTIILPANYIENTQEIASNTAKNIIDDKMFVENKKMQINGNYKVTVKQYMTEPSNGTFDFQDKWNNGIPMPMFTMVGKVIKETRGMIYMELHGQAEATCNCLHCGRTLTNKVSRLYGIGPICGQHYGINPFDTEEELNEHFEQLKEQISNIRWSGWIIRSSIKHFEPID